MAEFDPYLKWLGIRDSTRPVNHYRLLGLDLFETDKDVISMAADRQMSHIRTYQNGPNGKLSQNLLNELARARRCLLVEEKKTAYDAGLRQQLAGSPAPPIRSAGAPASMTPPPIQDGVPIVDAEVVPREPRIAPVSQTPNISQPPQADGIFGTGESVGVRTDPNAREKTKKRERKQLLWSIVGWISGGLAAVGVGAFLLNSGLLGNLTPEDNPDSTNRNGAVAKKADPNGTPKTQPRTQPKGTSKTQPKAVEPKAADKSTFPVTSQPDPVVGADLKNLTLIEGIELSTEFVLQSQKVSSLNDLASMSPQEVADLLKKSNFKDTDWKLGEYQQWIAQAKRLVGDQTEIKDALSEKQVASLVYRAGMKDGDSGNPSSVDSGNDNSTTGNVATPELFGDSLPVVSREPLPSLGTASRKHDQVVVFFNQLDAPVNVYYVNPDNEQELYFTLGARKNRSQFTQDGGSWFITDEAQTGIATFIATQGRNSALIDGRDADDSSIRSQTSKTEVEIVKQPVPSDAKWKEKSRELRETLGSAFEKAGQREVSENRGIIEGVLLDLDQEYKDDADSQFASLELVKEMSLVHGDSITALKAIREQDRRFEGFDFWDEAVMAMEDSGRKLTRSDDVALAREHEKQLRSLIDEAMIANESLAAQRLVEYGVRASARQGDARTAAFYKIKSGYIDQLSEVRKQGKLAGEKLAEDPENSRANSAYGEYMLLAKDDIPGAMKCWAKSNDKVHRQLALKESNFGEGKPDYRELAKAWLDVEQDPHVLLGHVCQKRAIKILRDGIKSKEINSSEMRAYMIEIKRLQNSLGL